MIPAFPFINFFFALAAAQTYPECTFDVARSDDCAAVINANACYNKFRWNAQTLTCIDGDNDAEKKRKVCDDLPYENAIKDVETKVTKVCACCSCVGKVMCDWATKQRYC